MPIYEYRATDQDHACFYCYSGFETLQKIADDALTVCPECGNTIQRVISPPNLQSKTLSSDVLNPNHFAKRGFTQYKKAGGGVYEKTAGDGPRFISGDDKKEI